MFPIAWNEISALIYWVILWYMERVQQHLHPIEGSDLNPSTTSHDCTRFFSIYYYHFKCPIFIILKINGNINQHFTSIFSNLNNFHSLEVVNRVSETQLQVGENSI